MDALPPASLAELVTARLRQEIVAGAFQFGEALSEAKVARRYDVSRTPVREAFARLEQEGLVRTEPQVGTFVFTMDREQFALLSEVRSLLEAAAFRAAAARRREPLIEDWRRETGTMAAAMREADPAAYSRADGAFHDALFRHAGNPYLEEARRSFWAKMAAVRNRLSTTPEHMAKSFAEHEELLRLLEAGQAPAAARLLERHIRNKGANFWPPAVAALRSLRERSAALRIGASG
ncbi:MAG TPA: GntR family transcriptional regulator [Falsiroseomonas sp.]|jgi:DNA-binding GntR family transcriptional regulator|nr:GntR family transcriptional regulator [Falsiroseomonas sp.]